jgi:chemotaxis signal transduction protein
MMLLRSASDLADRAAELRNEFDHGFAVAPSAESTAVEDLLAIRLAGQGFTLRLSEIAGLFADKKITRVPGGSVSLLGMAGFRGAIAPVYDLQRLLGLAAAKTPRWLVIASAAPVAFAFEGFEGQLRVDHSLITPRASVDQPGLSKSLIQIDGVLRPIVELSGALDAIKT